MKNKKYFWLVALASVSLVLGACTNTKTPNKPDPDVIDPDDPPTPPDPEKTISQIIVKDNTVPTSFLVGDTFSVDGGVLQIRYSDSTREEIAMTIAMIENAPDMSVAHEDYEVRVLYEGARTSYYINVAAGDTREEVSIGVEYEYNDGPRTQMVDNLSFYVGKPYKFYYGCHPNEAIDAIGVKYYEVGDPTPISKPEEVGNYIYKVYIAEGDELYKPVSVEYHFSIINVVTESFALNNSNAPTLSDVPSTISDEVDGVTVNYKNAKSASGAVATLVKQCAVDAKPTAEDNYIELGTAISLAGPLTVDFDGQDNFIYVYGSYDQKPEHFILLDTLTRAKTSTSRANDYCFIRLVAAPLGHSEVTINSISFTQEVDGVSNATVARAEKGDRFNHVSSDENNAYFHRRTDEVFDANYSNKSIGIRLKECSVTVDLGTTLSKEEVTNYQVSFKICPTENAVIHYSKDDETVQSEIGVYCKPVSGENTVGAHQKVVTIPNQVNWTTVNVDLSIFFADGASSINAFNVWLNRYCAEGAIVFDDFRLIQKNTYPVPYALTSISVSDMTTSFIKNSTFEFDGVITAHYSDYSETYVSLDNSNLTISEPNMSSSGTKTVTVSYTDGGVTKSTTYQITVSASGNPEDEEVLPIVAEENDLAKKANQYKSGREYDCGKTSDNTEDTYGNSTSSLNIYNLKVDADCYINIKLPAALIKNSIHVKFFAKNLPSPIYVQLMDVANLSDKDPALQRALVAEGATKTSASTDPASAYHFTATEAGNDWTMYEYDFYAANVTNGVNYFRLSTSVKLAADTTFIIDGLEVY